MKTLRPGDIENLSAEEAGSFWRDSEAHCARVIADNPIHEVDGMRVIMDEHGSVLSDHDGKWVSPVDPVWNSLEELESRRVRENVKLHLGGNFFDDDGK